MTIGHCTSIARDAAISQALGQGSAAGLSKKIAA